jgi:phage terminase large subunit-like protein
MAYRFCEDTANRAERFFSQLIVFVEGEKAGKPFVLEEWQRKIIRDLFGWLRDDGTRRYRIAYIEVPRKNGKSSFAAGIALYLLLCDKEQRPQVYSCAGDRDQARIVFNAARAMIERGPQPLRDKAELRQYQIRARSNGGWYEACSADDYRGHGLSPHGIIFDELHVQPNRLLWDAMLSGRGARRQPLVVAITTAGHDRSSICWEMHQRAEAAIAKPESDPTFYGAIFAAGEKDDWTDESVWAKANPNLGVSVSLEFLREECHAAQHNPALENVFRNLYLCQWTQQAVRWVQLDAWDRCQSGMSLDDFAGEPCWAALDLASTRDINALSLMFAREQEYHVFNQYWMPAEVRDVRGQNDRQQAHNWAEQGLIRKTEGDVADYQAIVSDIMATCERFDVRVLAYDPWGPARAVAQLLIRAGFPEENLREFRQNIGSFAAPSKEFERRIGNQTLRHNGDPVLRWMVGNVAAFRDNNDNIRPSKSKSADKIDGVVTTIMALGLALQESDEQRSVYENQGSLTL